MSKKLMLGDYYISTENSNSIYEITDLVKNGVIIRFVIAKGEFHSIGLFHIDKDRFLKNFKKVQKELVKILFLE